MRAEPDSAFIFAASSCGVSAHRNSSDFCGERLDRADGTGQHALQQLRDAAAGQVGVLLGAGQRELRAEDGLVEDEPRVVVAATR